MDTIMALKSIWFLIGVAFFLGIYAIGAYLKFWEINIAGTYGHRGYSYDGSLKRRPNGTFDNLPYAMNSDICYSDSSTKVQPDGSINSFPFGICYSDSSTKVQPDGSINSFPFGMGTAYHTSQMFSDDSRSLRNEF